MAYVHFDFATFVAGKSVAVNYNDRNQNKAEHLILH